MDKFFKDTLDEVIEAKQYETAKKMLKMHQTFPEYDEYMKKLDELSRK
jgi:hypothetical protein